MSSRTERQREEVLESGSPLSGHSLNHRNMRDQLQGSIRVFGRGSEKRKARQKRNDARTARRQDLYDSVVRIFDGEPSEEDVLKVVLLSDEFEHVDPDVINAVVIDFSGMTTSQSKVGEPEFYRKRVNH